MKHLLSIKTAWTQLGYAFMGNDPDAADNRWLREGL